MLKIYMFGQVIPMWLNIFHIIRINHCRTATIFLKLWIDSYSKENAYNWAIEYQGNCIGNISVVAQGRKNGYICHLGWQIDEPYWNNGIVTEAAKAVVDYLFEEIGCDRISSAYDTRNVGSGKVMQKIGMKFEGCLRRYYYQKDGSIGNRNLYSILRSEWQKEILIIYIKFYTNVFYTIYCGVSENSH